MVSKKMFFMTIGFLVYHAPYTSCMDYVQSVLTPLFPVKKISQAKREIVSEFIINDVNCPRAKRIIASLQQYEKCDLQNQFGSCGVAAIAGGTLTYMGIPEVGIFPLAIGAVGGAYIAMILGLHNAGYSYLYSAENTPELCNLLTLAGRSALQCSIQKTRLDPQYVPYPNARQYFDLMPIQLFNAQKNQTIQWDPNNPHQFEAIVSGEYNSKDWTLKKISKDSKSPVLHELFYYDSSN
jgi:hypothetical protein